MSWPEPTFLGGVQVDYNLIIYPGAGHGKASEAIYIIGGVIDFPFSIIGDLVMLPVNGVLLLVHAGGDSPNESELSSPLDGSSAYSDL